MRVAIIGANGQLGSDLVKVFQGGNVVPLTHSDIEITNPAQTDSVLRNIRPDV
ncbi:MAG TPA: dTDP-4-dehydrorhamnose reductase, partial [Planctomycetia bacterium]|nr:dTDP-4-dehydrorhamnose reductase [Planctomycetia bacterium]